MCGVFQEAIFLRLFPPVNPGDLTKTLWPQRSWPTPGWIDPNYAPFGCTSSFNGQSIHSNWRLQRAACCAPFVCVRMIVRALVHGKGSVGDPPQSLHSEEWGHHTESWRDIWRWGRLFVLINTNEPRLAWNSIGFFLFFFPRMAGGDYWLIGLVEVDGDLISCHWERS